MNSENDRPNILLLVADDLGYADLGCYGGDIETPNIDNLAANGIRFSRFHTSPLCAPTRAMLLSGNDNHIAGMGIQGIQNTEFGYEGKLTNRVVSIPALLRTTGYHTYMAGKWHLGRDSLSNPFSKGFERSFVNIRGAGNHYDDQGLFEEDPITPYSEDGKPAKWNDGDYSTDFYTDKLIEYIGLNKEDKKPFFAFAAFTSPHWPLQVDE
ncbi:MAG: sulfatase-like hydrolase/transferase, partial [Cyclobacteriaceae bacterium]|nr:sulfatase-like hydrolase/transferase [Cyclobacteriaceae bacterium]